MRSRNAASRCSDFLLVSSLAWVAVPEMWTKPLTIAEAPVHFFIAQFLWLSIVAEGLVKKAPRSKFLWLVLAVIGYASVRSAFAADRNHLDLKYLVSDLWTVQMFVLGLVWSRRRSFAEIGKVFLVATGVIVPVAFLTMVGLYFGIVRPADQEYSDRVYTSSLWSIACLAQFMWPVVASYVPDHQWGLRLRSLVVRIHFRVCRWLLAPTALVIAVVTATRSLLIVSLVVCAVVWATERSRDTHRSVVAAAVLLVFLGGGLTLASAVRAKGYSVLDRFEDADLTLDGRVTELQWMFEQLGDDYVSGWGLGSLFHSTIRYHNREFETAPHVGIVTFLLKGGVAMTLTFVLVPLMLCVPALRGRKPTGRAGVGCVVVYLATASLSGGWFPYQLLMFGVGVGLLTNTRRVFPRPVPGCAPGVAGTAGLAPAAVAWSPP